MSQRDQGRYPSSAGSAGRGGGQPQRSGLVPLGGIKRGRGPGGPPSAAPPSKLAVPKPVNLPSLKKENAGLDPNTQLVPTAGGGWSKPEEPAPPEAPANDASPLTAGSTWGSAQSRSAAAPWQPPSDPAAPVAAVLPFKLRSGFDRRRLNPSEYPSLEAAGRKSALVAQLALNKAPTSALLGPPSGLDTSGRNWDDEDRAAPARPPSADWYERFDGEGGAYRRRPDDQPQFGPPAGTEGRPPFSQTAADVRPQPPPRPATWTEPEAPVERERPPAPPAAEDDGRRGRPAEGERPPSQPPCDADDRGAEQRSELRSEAADRWRTAPPAANGRPPRFDEAEDQRYGRPPAAEFAARRNSYDDRRGGGFEARPRPGGWDDDRSRARFNGGPQRYDGPQRGRPYSGGGGGGGGHYDGGPSRSRLTDGPPRSSLLSGGPGSPPQTRSALIGGPPPGGPDAAPPLRSALAGPPPAAAGSHASGDRRPASARDANRAAREVPGETHVRPASQPAQHPGPAVPVAAAAQDEEELLDDSEAFMAELDRIAAEKEQLKKQKAEEAAAQAAAAIEAQEAEEAAAAAAIAAEEARKRQQAEGPAARAKELAAQAEAEERRKAAAQAKLLEIEARIAAREAEAQAKAEREAAEAAAAAEAQAKANAEAAEAEDAARKQQEAEAASFAQAAAPAASEAETTPLLSKVAAADPAPSPVPAPVHTPSPPPLVNAWSKPLTLVPPHPPKQTPPSPQQQQQQPPQPPAPASEPSTAAEQPQLLASPSRAKAADVTPEEPAAETSAGRGGRARGGRARGERSGPRDIANAAADKAQQHQQQPPKGSSPKDGSVRKRSRGGNKPPGRTLPLPVAGPKSADGSSPVASPPQRQPATVAPAVPPGTAPTVSGEAPAPLPAGPVAAAAAGPLPPVDVSAMGGAMADLVLAEPPPQPAPAPPAAVLDPVVPAAGGAAPIARPRSRAALAEDHTLASGVLANGIPALPAGLSLDAPGGPPPHAGNPGAPPASQQPMVASAGFGGFPPAPASAPPPHAPGLPSAFGGSGFGFGGFGFGGGVPASAAGLWQQPAPKQQQPQQQQPVGQPQHQHILQQQQQQPPPPPPPPQRQLSSPPGLLGSQQSGNMPLDALYRGQGSGFDAFTQPPMQQPMQQQQHMMQEQLPPQQQQQHQLGRLAGLQAPQFGTFGVPSGGHGHEQQHAFGGFGQTAFVPTGKQPDWSVPSGAGVPSSSLSSASQAFAAGGHHSSGSLSGMNAPLGGGGGMQQDAGRAFLPPGQHGGGFGAPAQHQHGGHAFFNQPHNPLGLSMAGGSFGGGFGGNMGPEANLPDDLIGDDGGGGVRQRGPLPPHGGRGLRAGRGGRGGGGPLQPPPQQFGGPGGPPQPQGRGGRGPSRAAQPGSRGARAPGRGEAGRGDVAGRGGRGGSRSRGSRSPVTMKPVYAAGKPPPPPPPGSCGGPPQQGGDS